MTKSSDRNGEKNKKKKGKKRLVEETSFQTPLPTLKAPQSDLPSIIPSAALLFQLQSNPQPNPLMSNTEPPAQQVPPPQQVQLNPLLPSANIGEDQTPGTSCSGVGGTDNSDNMLLIEPDGDGFNSHIPVIHGISSCIKSKFDIGEPRWKKFPNEIREVWFAEFKRKFKWAPRFNLQIRENFEKRGSAKLSQLLQRARKQGVRPCWIGETAWGDLVKYWQSKEFKAKSEQNKRNHNSSAGASLHTGGCIPHRVHFRRMKDERGGEDPSFSEFYFRTHKRKKNSEWVHKISQDAYENFEKKKHELSSQSIDNVEDISGGNVAQSQSIASDIQIYVEATGGKKKGRVAGFGSLGRSIIKSSTGSSQMETISQEVEERIRTEVQQLNASLQASLQADLEKERKENEDIRKENQEIRKELGETKKMLTELMEKLGYKSSSSLKHSNDDKHTSSGDDSNYEGTSEEDSSDEA